LAGGGVGKNNGKEGGVATETSVTTLAIGGKVEFRLGKQKRGCTLLL